jgi:long-chain fatty acid transport protein
MHTLRTSLFAALGGALGLCALAGTASANGFFINEHDAKATGRAGATTASNGDASSIIFSPGGIALGEGTDVSLTASLIAAKGSYFDASNMDARTDTDSSPAVLPSIFVRTRINDMFAAGIGFHLPFGLAVSWPDAHAQADVIQDQTLRTYFITPAVGLNLNKVVPGLSIGGGVDLVPSTVKLEQAIIFGDTRGTAVLGGSAFGIGGRAGVQYRPAVLPQLRIGAMWRSQVNLSYEGKGDFDIDPAFRSQLPPDGDISTSIKLPQMFGGGIAVNPVPALQLEVNAMWINWSKFDELRIELPGGAETVSPQDYEDTVTLRVGAEYAIGRKAAVRAGYIYDPTPIPGTTLSARLPDADRHDITAGGSLSLGDYDVHLGLLWVLPSSKETSDIEFMPEFKGKYEVTAFVASLSLAGKFGK